MKLSEEIIDGVTVIHLAGSLTQDGSPQLEKRFNELSKIKGAPAPSSTSPKSMPSPRRRSPSFFPRFAPSRRPAGKIVFANVKGITGDIFTRCRLDVIFTMAGNIASAVKITRRVEMIRAISFSIIFCVLINVIRAGNAPPAPARGDLRAGDRDGADWAKGRTQSSSTATLRWTTAPPRFWIATRGSSRCFAPGASGEQTDWGGSTSDMTTLMDQLNGAAASRSLACCALACL